MSETPVANHMEAFLGKARGLVDDGKKTGLAGVVVEQIKLLRSLAEDVVKYVYESEGSGLDSGGKVQEWLEKVKTATSEADLLLDECAYDRYHHLNRELEDKKWKKVRKFFSLLNMCSKMSKQISASARKLRECLKEAYALSLKVRTTSDDAVMANNRLLFSPRQKIDCSVIETQLVRENYEVPKRIDELLRSEDTHDEDLSFVSYVGWGGDGKSVLARIVYNDDSVVYHFHERMWVRVSEDLDVDRILKDMLTNLTGTRSEIMLSITHATTSSSSSSVSATASREAILRKLQERLKGKKFLLVLDDVCDDDIALWDSLMNCLFNLGGARGSKVILTTCVEEVAGLVRSSFVFNLSFGSDDYSWTLFEKIAFAKGGAMKTSALDDIGRSIVKECQGNIICIKLMASLMYYVNDENQWSCIKESEKWQDLSHNIPGLCYDFLPSMSVKKCFLYCSIFPKGSVIDREELIRLWMVQGFLNPPKGSNLKMEDVGAIYHDILLGYSFLVVSEDNEVDRKSCRVDDILHRFALSKSKGYCEALENMDVKSDFEAVHLSLINCKIEFPRSVRDVFSKLRTLRLENMAAPGCLEAILNVARGLHVLIIVDHKVDKLSSSIGKLKHLKYLDISRTKIVNLPDSIVELYNLHTLKLHDLQKLPANFEKLVKLRYLFVETFKDSAKTTILPSEIRKLLDPRSYKAFLDSETKIENLKLHEHPQSFSSLRIYCLENVRNAEEASTVKLSKMTGIESLKFHWNARRENCYDEDVLRRLEPHTNIKTLVIENFKGLTFPPWMAEPELSVLNNLEKVELENCCWCETLPPLGHLPHLKIVKIIGMDSVKSIGKEFFGFTDLYGESSDPTGEISDSIGESSNSTGRSITSDVFPVLKEFTLRRMESLEDWSGTEYLSTESIRLFPFLEKFEVEHCPKLISLPDVILASCSTYLLRIEIALCDKLNHLPSGIGSLNSLEELEIRGLPSLPCLTVGSVKKLRILTIGSFSSDSEESSPLNLKRESAELKSLPQQIQYLSGLRNLTIWGYAALEELPGWLANLKSLRTLKLEFCWKLVSLPPADKLKKLTSLKELNICHCPLLEDRCTKASRPEWNKISHIETITINYETIKSKSRLQL